MIKISADSTCDLSAELLSQYDIAITPLSIVMEEQVFKDGVDLQPPDLFRLVEAGKTCQTGAVNIYEYEQHFQALSSEYEAVIHICLGSGFSSCYANATLAAEKFPNVFVLDSQNLSTGMGHLVYDAALLAQEGFTASEIMERLQATVPKISASFVLDQLDYLVRGGRCSALTAQGAKMLRLRPSIEVRDGAMIVGRKYRGSLEKVLENYVLDRLNANSKLDLSRIFITHSGCEPETVALVRSIIEEQADFEEIVETEAGCTISNHCGPNTLGILYKCL